MDCADAQNLYAGVYALNTYPNLTRVYTAASFSGQALSVGVSTGGAGAGFTSIGTSCQSPAFDGTATYVTVDTAGNVCHAQTVLAITGMTVSATGYGRWGGSWYGTSVSAWLDMYPR
jgi:hypothetical protein